MRAGTMIHVRNDTRGFHVAAAVGVTPVILETRILRTTSDGNNSDGNNSFPINKTNRELVSFRLLLKNVKTLLGEDVDRSKSVY
jgi:hypothetical protein